MNDSRLRFVKYKTPRSQSRRAFSRFEIGSYFFTAAFVAIFGCRAVTSKRTLP